MADVNKTIEISMTADLKSLQKQLSRIPGMTKEEAKAMTKALQRELKQAQAAAKKTAQVNKRAMAQVTKANNRAAKSAKNLRTQSREMGAAFGSLEDVVGEVSPELAGLAMTVGTVGQGFRALSRSMATGNPLVLALVASVAALAAGYHILTTATREAEQRQKDLALAADELNEKLKTQRDIANEVVSAHRDATLELEVFTGQISELDAEIIKARDAAGDQLSKQLEKQDEIIKNQEKDIELVKKAAKSRVGLKEEEEKRLNLLINTSKIQSVNNSMSLQQGAFGIEMVKLQDELNNKLVTENAFRTKIITTNKETLETREELLNLQAEYAKEQKEEAERQRRIAEYRQAALKRQKELQDAINDSEKTFESTQNRIDSMRISRLSKEEQINANAERRKKDIDTEIEALEKQFEQAEKIARTQKDKTKLSELDVESAKASAKLMEEQSEIEKQRLFEIAELRNKLREEQKKLDEKKQADDLKRIEERKKQELEFANLMISSTTDVFRFGLQLAEETGNKNKDLINVLFRANQAAAIADIIMSTAQALAAAPAQYGPLAPAAIPAIVAGGAVQLGVVASQKPPLHMGGIVQPLAPDEQSRTLLTGEAVLDRATTRRLGENGINKLQNGKNGGPDVIVMSPFKHLDRYNRSALRNPNSSFNKMKATTRSRY